jgi:hypothetical protein
LIDLKKCINAVHTNQSFPGRREDFSSQLGYDNWQKREVKQLQELMKTTMLLNPNLSIANSGEQEFSSSLLSSRRGSDNNSNRRSSYYGDDPLVKHELIRESTNKADSLCL